MESLRIVVAYCRVSTLEQKRKGYGIDIQILDVTLFAGRHGLFVRRFYKDEAQSGVAEGRQAQRRLLRDCRRGMVGTVVLLRLIAYRARYATQRISSTSSISSAYTSLSPTCRRTTLATAKT
jgi:DNA invertase Pin-like site-specific DNA recombinase